MNKMNDIKWLTTPAFLFKRKRDIKRRKIIARNITCLPLNLKKLQPLKNLQKN